MTEQRTPYLGRSSRAWLKLDFVTLDGTRDELALVVDTCCPFDLVLAPEVFDTFAVVEIAPIPTNFGAMPGGRVWLHMPEIGLDLYLEALRSDRTKLNLDAEHPDFSGMVGLPFLRLGEYGGNACEFWFRYPPPTPISHP